VPFHARQVRLTRCLSAASENLHPSGGWGRSCPNCVIRGLLRGKCFQLHPAKRSCVLPDETPNILFPVLHTLSHRASQRRVYPPSILQQSHPSIRSLFLISSYRCDDRGAQPRQGYRLGCGEASKSFLVQLLASERDGPRFHVIFGDAARGTLLLILGSLEEGEPAARPSRNKQGCAGSCQPSSRGTVDLDNLNLAILGYFLAGPQKRFGLSLRTPLSCLYLLVPLRDFLKHFPQTSTLTNKDCHERLETQTQRA